VSRTDTRRVKETLLESARKRALQRGYAFDISIGQLDWPALCPALGIPLDYGRGVKPADNHPSLDQTVPRGGYTRANARIISRRANQVKGNATALELFLVAKYVAAELGLQLYVADDTVSTPPSVKPIGVTHMSDNLRVIALQHAVAVTKTGDEALAAAGKFHAFLSGTAPAAAAGKAPAATAAGKPAAGKAATGKPAAAATPEAKAAARLAAKNAAAAAAEDAAEDPDAGEGEPEGPTKQEVGDAIKALMAANMRTQAKDLLAEFGAEALSGLAPDDYPAFIEKANELLIAA
jgi:hypothetical protein